MLAPSTAQPRQRRISQRRCHLHSSILALLVVAGCAFAAPGAAQDPPKALVKRCAQGDAESCYGIGLNQSSRNPFESRRHYALACGSGHRKACKELHDASDELLEGASGGHAEAVSHLEVACGQDYGRSCSSLATALWEGSGAAPDRSRARALWEKGCALGSRIGCRRSGGIYEGGELVAKDLGRALAFFERACELELESACADAGRLLSAGIVASSMAGGVSEPAAHEPADRSAAIAPLRQACLEANVANMQGDACFNLGTLLTEGNDVERDTVLAFEAFRRGCSGDHAASCTAAGHAAEAARGTDRDLNAATNFFGKACSRKSAAACQQLCRIQCEAGQPAACRRVEARDWPMHQSCALP